MPLIALDRGSTGHHYLHQNITEALKAELSHVLGQVKQLLGPLPPLFPCSSLSSSPSLFYLANGGFFVSLRKFQLKASRCTREILFTSGVSSHPNQPAAFLKKKDPCGA